MPMYGTFLIYTKATLMSIDDFIKLYQSVLEERDFILAFVYYTGEKRRISPFFARRRNHTEEKFDESIDSD
jgi:hypothetical protein